MASLLPTPKIKVSFRLENDILRSDFFFIALLAVCTESTYDLITHLLYTLALIVQSLHTIDLNTQSLHTMDLITQSLYTRSTQSFHILDLNSHFILLI